MSNERPTLDMALTRINARLLRQHEQAALLVVVMSTASAAAMYQMSDSWMVGLMCTFPSALLVFVVVDRLWLRRLRRMVALELSELLDADDKSRQRLAPFPVLQHLNTDSESIVRPAPVPERHARTR